MFIHTQHTDHKTIAPKSLGKKFLGFIAVALITTSITGCNTVSRLASVGDGPTITPIINPQKKPGYRSVSMPMPTPQIARHNPNSLWRAGARAFFKDQRAKAVGDILTVNLNISESASLNNKTERTRDDSEDGNVTNLLGLEAELTKKLPQAINPLSTMSLDTDHVTKGEGKIARDETLELQVAAVIVQVLPNGNLVIHGRQELKVNAELRELQVAGIVRPEDIDTTNAVSHEKIAEMRLAYGGRGSISDLQTPRWGLQVLDILLPF
ncbi:MAG: flagellar basal body L-ring protein FlgH [Rhodospirillales bacterium]|nr:flagellar basal body L-ring protein FlgH [Rhodospirillales bacterium]